MITVIDDTTGKTYTTGNKQKPESMAARIAALKKRAANTSETEADESTLWQPVAGDILCGVILGYESIVTRQCGDSTLMLVQNEFGAIVKTWLNSWLQSNLETLGADIGDLIVLTFRGKMKSGKTGREFNAYSVVVDN